MNKLLKATLICSAVACSALLVIHRRVIAAAITGEPMPETPEWHKKFLPCCFDQDPYEDYDDEPDEEDDEEEGWS